MIADVAGFIACGDAADCGPRPLSCLSVVVPAWFCDLPIDEETRLSLMMS